MQYRVKAWTGPTCVSEIADKMRECPGLSDVIEGTEHVYATVDAMDAPGAAWNFLVELRLKHDTDFGLKPVTLHSAPQPINTKETRAYSKVRQTACRHCGQDIENFAPYRNGEWRDRGNNTECPDGSLPDAKKSRNLKHAPIHSNRQPVNTEGTEA